MANMGITSSVCVLLLAATLSHAGIIQIRSPDDPVTSVLSIASVDSTSFVNSTASSTSSTSSTLSSSPGFSSSSTDSGTSSILSTSSSTSSTSSQSSAVISSTNLESSNAVALDLSSSHASTAIRSDLTTTSVSNSSRPSSSTFSSILASSDVADSSAHHPALDFAIPATSTSGNVSFTSANTTSSSISLFTPTNPSEVNQCWTSWDSYWGSSYSGHSGTIVQTYTTYSESVVTAPTTIVTTTTLGIGAFPTATLTNTLVTTEPLSIVLSDRPPITSIQTMTLAIGVKDQNLTTPACVLPSSVSQCQSQWETWALGTSPGATFPPACTNAVFSSSVCTSFISSFLEYQYNDAGLQTPGEQFTVLNSTYTSSGAIMTTWQPAVASWSPDSTVLPGCTIGCQQCRISGNQVQLLYWPPATANSSNITAAQQGPITAVTYGTTLTSPTPYISFDSLYARDSCSEIGTTVSNTIVAITNTADLSSIYGWGQFGPVDSSAIFNFNDLYQTYVPDSIYNSQPRCASSSQAQNSQVCDNESADDDSTTGLLVLNVGQGGCSSNTSFVCPRTLPYEPVISVPQEVRALQPAWASCIGGLRGVYDPPKALVQAAAAFDPTSLSFISLPAQTTSPSEAAPDSTTKAAPQPTPTSNPAPTSPPSNPATTSSPAAVGGGAKPASSDSSSDRNSGSTPSQSDIDSSSSSSAAAVGGTGADTSTGTSGSGSSNPSSGSSGSEGSGSSNTGTGGTSPGHSDSSSPGSTGSTGNTGASSSASGDSGSVGAAGTGSSANTGDSGTSASSGHGAPGSASNSGSSSNDNSGNADSNQGQGNEGGAAIAPPPATFGGAGGAVISAQSQGSNVVVAAPGTTATVQNNGQAVTVAGETIVAGKNGNGIAVDGSSIAVPATAPSPTVAFTNPNGNIVSAQQQGSNVVVQDGTSTVTVVAGNSAILGGQTLNAPSGGGAIVAGTSTFSLIAPAPAVAAVTFTAPNGNVVSAQQQGSNIIAQDGTSTVTITAGSTAFLGSQTLSAPSAGGVIVAGTSTYVFVTPIPAVATFTAPNGDVVSAKEQGDKLVAHAGSSTVTIVAGSSAVLNGQTLNAPSGVGAIVAGGSTYSLAAAVSAATPAFTASNGQASSVSTGTNLSAKQSGGGLLVNNSTLAASRTGAAQPSSSILANTSGASRDSGSSLMTTMTAGGLMMLLMAL